MTVKELIDKLQQFDEDKLVLVEDTEYKEFQAIEVVPMRASMALSAGYKIGNAHPDDMGYEVTYPDGYKSWNPAKEFEKACVKPENFDLNVGSNYA